MKSDSIYGRRRLTLVAVLLAVPLAGMAQEQVSFDGTLYEIVDGGIYEVDGDQRSFVAELYDPTHLSRSYTEIDGVIHRIDPSDGATYATFDRLLEDFGSVQDVVSAIGPDTGWTALTLQSPSAPDVSDYVELWHRMVRGEEGCRDNCVAIAEVDGEPVLRATAVAAGRRSGVSKASLDTGLLHLTAGETFRFSADFRIDEGMPVSLVDIEASYMMAGPGLRVMLTEEGVPWVQLKWADQPRWMPQEAVSVPQGVWFNLVFEADLAREGGRVRLWLDDVLLIDAPGQTLPLSYAVLDRMELGITAAVSGPTTLLVDNVAFLELD